MFGLREPISKSLSSTDFDGVQTILYNRSNMLFQCYYCDRTTKSYKDIINHLIETHEHEELKFKRTEGQHSKVVGYKVIPDICREQGRVIHLDETNKSIHVSRRNVIPKESPLKKICKIIDPLSDTDDHNPIEEVNFSVNTDDDFQELSELLPEVIKALKECGKYDDYKAFNKLICDGKFPLDNIAFLLFLDVVRWYSLNKSTTFMRYSEPCKLFWRTGYKLFRGRFLRFMGGPKNKGLTTDDDNLRGHFSADDSSVNFVVPDRKILKDECKMLSTDKPGIITEMIDDISRMEECRSLTYKICVDGKKINPSSKGQVDLWGYEGDPTLDAKQQRMRLETNLLNSYIKEIESEIQKGHCVTSELITSVKNSVVDSCRKSITLLSHRMKDLRMLKVKKMIALNKLQEQIQGDWRSSNYAIVISSIRTSIYQIENCLEDMLNINGNLCRYAALIEKSVNSLTAEVVDLSRQWNYVCLGNSVSLNDLSKPEITKQRSQTWFKIRENSLVTGSTINKAIGLEGLKEQKNYLDTKAGRKDPEPISDELQLRFDHGKDNELNAIATFVSTFIPAFEPFAFVFEEGCYIFREDDKAYLVVSPDGSVRTSDGDKTLAAVEIKCPTPGKLYTTPVQYTLPHYYVPQVLSEMKCLDVKNLYFVSYGTESTAVHMVEFDEQLWNEICEEIKKLDQDASPKRLGKNVTLLKSNIDKFRHSRVQLIAEVKSRKAKACQHESDQTDRIYHLSSNAIPDDILLTELQRAFIRGVDAVKASDSLCTNKANEVLVFMLADLDRIHRPEIPYAFPIAYALKGYSMKSSAMRSMISDVLHELFLKGLYTPVVSYDGQWAVLAYRANDGKPLTLLELQKQVYNDVKSRKKGDLTKLIFETGVIKTDQDMASQIQYTYDANRKAAEVSFNGDKKLFQPSLNIREQITCGKQKGTKHGNIDSVTDETDTNYDIASAVPTEALENLTDEEMETLQNMDHNIVSGQQNTEQQQPIQRVERVNLCDTIFATTVDNADDSHLAAQMETCSDLTEQIEQLGLSGDSVDINSDEEQMPCETVLGHDDIVKMLISLQTNDKANTVWKNRRVDEFKCILLNTVKAKKEMSKFELTLCLETVSETLKSSNIHYSKCWNKSKMVDLLQSAVTKISIEQRSQTRARRRRNPDKLITLCKKKVNNLSKSVLNSVVAEYEMVGCIELWRQESPFSPETEVSDQRIRWFSTPEYNPGTLSYIFSFLDVHHLITNCRVKVCKDGIPERGLSKQAWIDVAKENTTRLKVPHVVDLVDKQSDSIARETFSEEVENAMRNHYPNEAAFCKMIREFYDGEDNPGISAEERCDRRLTLRRWLLEDVNFCHFPPYGSHIRGIPNVMFQGFITNIERRIQLFPYVKSGTYNVRSLGSLEAENMFGQFQDLDPKGSGIIRAEEVPSALENACQLLRVQLMPERPFHMSLSKAKVYPVHDLLAESEMDCNISNQYLYPSIVCSITIRDHMFDTKSRCKRKAKRRLVEIKGPDEAARGVSGVRQYHKCDESKILPHKRLGIDI